MTTHEPRVVAVQDVFHEAATSAFEANVILQDGQTCHAYAVSVPAPITADFDALRPALIAAARRAHGAGRSALRHTRTSRAMPDRSEDMLARILAAQPDYLAEILRRAA